MRAATITPNNSRGKYETRGRGSTLPTVEEMIRHAHESTTAAGLPVSVAKVSKLCRWYVKNVAPHGVAFNSWFVAQVAASGAPRELLTAELYQRLTYLDPTGERATRNVDAARRSGVATA